MGLAELEEIDPLTYYAVPKSGGKKGDQRLKKWFTDLSDETDSFRSWLKTASIAEIEELLK